jgi:hypothetical protein
MHDLRQLRILKSDPLCVKIWRPRNRLPWLNGGALWKARTLLSGCRYFGPTAQLAGKIGHSPGHAARCHPSTRRRCPALCLAKRNQLFRGFPELPVDEIGSEAAQECELFSLPGPDLLDTRPEGRKGLLQQFIRRY